MSPPNDDLERSAATALTAAGAASDAERAAMEAEAARDPRAAEDLAFWRAVAATATAAEADAAAMAPSPPGEKGWARIEAALRAERAAGSARAAPTASAPPRPRAARPAGRGGAGPGVWRPLAIAASVLVAAQAALLLSYPAGPPPETPPSDALRGAIGPQESALAPELLARVAFRPEAREDALRRLMLETDARIVDGPSALGLYTLAFPDRGARDAALDRYAVRSNLVESADPVEAQP